MLGSSGHMPSCVFTYLVSAFPSDMDMVKLRSHISVVTGFLNMKLNSPASISECVGLGGMWSSNRMPDEARAVEYSGVVSISCIHPSGFMAR